MVGDIGAEEKIDSVMINDDFSFEMLSHKASKAETTLAITAY